MISRGDGDGNDLGAIGDGAKRFGLHAFCFAGIFSERDELIGSLQMFSSFRRSPSVEESRLIERATCLAAIAINLDICASRDASDAATAASVPELGLREPKTHLSRKTRQMGHPEKRERQEPHP